LFLLPFLIAERDSNAGLALSSLFAEKVIFGKERNLSLPEHPLPDPAILTQILFLQSQLLGASDSQELAGFVVKGLSQLPGVQGIGLCIDGKILDSSVPGLDLPPACRGVEAQSKTPPECPTACPWETLPQKRCYRLKTRQHCYGGLLLQISDPLSFDVFDPLFAHLSHFIAQLLETRRQMERRLLDSEDKSRNFFYQSPMGSVIVGLDHHFLHCNRTFCRFLGYEEPELIGKTFLDVTHPEDRHIGQAEIKALLADELEWATVEKRYLRKDGCVVWGETTINLVKDEKGIPTHFNPVIQDITERKQAEEHRLRLERQMQQVQKLESLGVLAGGIAHDFNNLLMAILGNAELALEDLPSISPIRENLEEINNASRRAAELCRQMLAYAGKGRYLIETIRLEDLIQDLVPLLKASISKKTLLTLNLEEKLPPLHGDATQIRQVVMNLVINASESLGDKNGVVAISSGILHCSRSSLSDAFLADDLADGPFVWLEVSDNGSGMDPETQRRIFEPFFTTKFAGRGLGLSAVLGIVRSHKGALIVHSDLGKGSSFRVFLPASEEQICCRLPASAEMEDWIGSGTILLVDDEETIRETTGKALQRLGFQVLTVPDGQEALRIYREHEKEIVLVLLDFTMPRLNGEETFAELKQLNPRVRVVMASGYSESDIASQLAGQGLAGVLHKPFDKMELQRVLQAALRPHA
jgi:two-component system cell cycle sensor histidine kinase/response regulator CckA